MSPRGGFELELPWFINAPLEPAAAPVAACGSQCALPALAIVTKQ